MISMIFPLSSYGRWQKVTTDIEGNEIYLEIDSIKKDDGDILFWYLYNLPRPDSQGVFSDKTYARGDCNIFRYKWLSVSYYMQQMGKGTPKVINYDNRDWSYPYPGTAMESVLKSACKI